MLLLSLTLSLLSASPGAIKLAAPGFSVLNVPENAARYYSDHLAHQLDVEGIEVITPTQVSALLGVERQKQLLGCSDSSCVVELANALGADGVITGSLGKFADAYQVDIKILSTRDGRPLGHRSRPQGARRRRAPRAALRRRRQLDRIDGFPL